MNAEWFEQGKKTKRKKGCDAIKMSKKETNNLNDKWVKINIYGNIEEAFVYYR